MGMVEARIDSVRVNLATQNRVVILKEVDAERYLPIWIGAFEADAIISQLQNLQLPRPMTHDLLKSVITELGARVTRIVVNDLKDDTFYARISLMDRNGRYTEVDSRPSDAIALAVRFGAPIYVEESVMERAGVIFDDTEAEEAEEGRAGSARRGRGRTSPSPEATGEAEKASEIDEEKLAIFRDFINSLNLDDLGKPDEGGQEKKER